MGADEATVAVIPRRKSQEQRSRDHSHGFVSTQLNKGVLYFDYQKSDIAMRQWGIYTRNNPPRLEKTRNEKDKIDYVKGVPRNEFLESSRVAVGLLRSLQCFGNNSILENPNDVLLVALES